MTSSNDEISPAMCISYIMDSSKVNYVFVYFGLKAGITKTISSGTNSPIFPKT